MRIEGHICPSSKAKPGARLLGVRQPEGWVALLTEPRLIDGTFIEEASEFGKLEERFRFANKCVGGGCAQWTGESCGVGSKVANVDLKNAADFSLPHCGIRANCRWHTQEGDDACIGCLFVITEVNQEELNTIKST